MSRPSLFSCLAVVFYAMLLLCRGMPAAQAQQYEINDLGTLGNNCTPAGINASGQVVGTSLTATPTVVPNNSTSPSRAFLFSNGSLTDLGTLGGVNSYGKGINTSGQATGYSDGTYSGKSTQHGVLWNGNVLTDLGTLSGVDYSNSQAFAINDTAQVVATSPTTQTPTSSGPVHAALWSAGTWADLGTLGGYSTPAAINNSGQVVGTSYSYSFGVNHAFLYNSGSLIDIDNGWFGSNESYATAVNSSGMAAGYYLISGSSYHVPFFYLNGTRTYPALPSYATNGAQLNAVSNNGLVVGTLFSTSGSTHAFLYANGQSTDLNTLLPLNSGWALITAVGINDTGQIVGTGIYNGTARAFLLTPYAVNAAAPTTTLSLSGAALTNGWYPVDQTVTLIAASGTSGVVAATTFYRVDSGETQTYSAPFVVGGRGGHSIHFWSVDTNGNTESPHTRLFTINNFPTIAAVSPSSVPAGNGDTRLTLSGTYFFPGAQIVAVVSQGGTYYPYYPVTSTILATAYVSPTQITAVLPAALTASGANIQLSVLNPTYGGYSAPAAFSVLNPVPTLTGVSPAAADAGQQNLTVTVTGTNFMPTANGGSVYYSPASAVAWNGTTLYTTFVSSTQLTASIPTSYLKPGTAQVTVVNPAPGGGTSNALPYTVRDVLPVTTIAFSGLGNTPWYRSLTITLSATDPQGTDDVATTLYGIDTTTPYLTYSAPFVVTSEGYHTIYFASRDKEGHQETATGWQFGVDATPPAFTLSSISGYGNTNGSGWYHSDVYYGVSVRDTLSGVQYIATPSGTSFFSSSTNAQSASIPISGEGRGLQASATAADWAGNITAYVTPLTNIDKTAPVTALGVSGTTAVLSASDALSGVAATYYVIDGYSQQTYSAPFTLAERRGSYSVRFWSVDVAGNVEAAKTQIVFGDVTPPTTTASLFGTAGNNGWYTSAVQVILTATDNASGVANTFYTLDGVSPQTYSAPFTITVDGIHSLTFWSVDRSGNTEPTNIQTVKLDTMAPAVTFGTPTPTANAAGWNNTPVDVPYTASDATSGIASALPGSLVHFGAEGAGQTQTVTVTDMAGNVITRPTPAVSIDLTAPITTASVAGATVTLAASDALSGVANTVYRSDGGTQTAYNGPFTVTGAGTHTVSFFSTDMAGNAEAAQTVTVSIAAPLAVLSLSLSPTTVKGGAATSTGTITLSAPAPAGGAAVKQTSSDTTAATLAPTLNIPAGATSAKFKITTYAVMDTQAITITSTLNGTSQRATLTVTGTAPVTVSGLSLSPASVPGGSASTGTVTLSAPAPTDGAVVSLLSSDTASATVPSSVTVAAGQTTAKFTVTSGTVTSTKSVTITATLGTSSQPVTLTVTPASLAITVVSLSLSPTSVKGGVATSTGTVTLSGPAPAGGVSITQSSSDTSAATLAPKLTIAAGATSAKFKITTYAVTMTRTVTITSALSGTAKNGTLTVTH